MFIDRRPNASTPQQSAAETAVHAAFNAKGDLLAVCSPLSIALWVAPSHSLAPISRWDAPDVQRRTGAEEDEMDRALTRCAWHPSSHLLAAATLHRTVHLVDVDVLSDLPEGAAFHFPTQSLRRALGSGRMALRRTIAVSHGLISDMSTTGATSTSQSLLLLLTTSGSLLTVSWHTGEVLHMITTPAIVRARNLSFPEGTGRLESGGAMAHFSLDTKFGAMATALSDGSLFLFRQPDVAAAAAHDLRLVPAGAPAQPGTTWRFVASSEPQRTFSHIAVNGRYHIVAVTVRDFASLKFFSVQTRPSTQQRSPTHLPASEHYLAASKAPNIQDWCANVTALDSHVEALAWTSNADVLCVLVAQAGVCGLHASGAVLFTTFSRITDSIVPTSWKRRSFAARSGDSLTMSTDEASSSAFHLALFTAMSYTPLHNSIAVVDGTGSVALFSCTSSPEGGGFGTPAVTSALLGATRVSFLDGADEEDRTEADTNAASHGGFNMTSPSNNVSTVAPPSMYLLTNAPLQHVAVSPDGQWAVTTGKAGCAIFHRLLRKWRLFGAEAQEKQLNATAAPVWISNLALALPVRRDPKLNPRPGQPYSIIVFPRYHLELSSAVMEWPLERRPTLLSTAMHPREESRGFMLAVLAGRAAAGAAAASPPSLFLAEFEAMCDDPVQPKRIALNEVASTMGKAFSITALPTAACEHVVVAMHVVFPNITLMSSASATPFFSPQPGVPCPTLTGRAAGLASLPFLSVVALLDNGDIIAWRPLPSKSIGLLSALRQTPAPNQDAPLLPHAVLLAQGVFGAWNVASPIVPYQRDTYRAGEFFHPMVVLGASSSAGSVTTASGLWTLTPTSVCFVVSRGTRGCHLVNFMLSPIAPTPGDTGRLLVSAQEATLFDFDHESVVLGCVGGTVLVGGQCLVTPKQLNLDTSDGAFSTPILRLVLRSHSFEHVTLLHRLIGAPLSQPKAVCDPSAPFISQAEIDRLRNESLFVETFDRLLHAIIHADEFFVVKSFVQAAGDTAATQQVVISATSSERRLLLHRVVQLLRRYPEYYDIVVLCVRKCDAGRWRTIFDVIGPPQDFMQECLALDRGGASAPAAHMVRVMLMDPGDGGSIWTLEEGLLIAARIFSALIQQQQVPVALELLRFVSRLTFEREGQADDDVAAGLREALKKATRPDVQEIAAPPTPLLHRVLPWGSDVKRKPAVPKAEGPSFTRSLLTAWNDPLLATRSIRPRGWPTAQLHQSNDSPVRLASPSMSVAGLAMLYSQPELQSSLQDMASALLRQGRCVALMNFFEHFDGDLDYFLHHAWTPVHQVAQWQRVITGVTPLRSTRTPAADQPPGGVPPLQTPLSHSPAASNEERPVETYRSPFDMCAFTSGLLDEIDCRRTDPLALLPSVRPYLARCSDVLHRCGCFALAAVCQLLLGSVPNTVDYFREMVDALAVSDPEYAQQRPEPGYHRERKYFCMVLDMMSDLAADRRLQCMTSVVVAAVAGLTDRLLREMSPRAPAI